MQTKVEAPVPEPLSLERNGVELTGVGRRLRRGAVALEGLSLSVRPRRGRGGGRALRLRQVHAARARGGAPGARRRRRERWATQGTGEPPAATCPSATCCCPGATRSATRRWRSSARACRRARRGGCAEPLFERFGLAEFEGTRPAGLSGGMRQRVAFLRTLLPGRPVLLLDEPFASLDSITRASMQQWLADALLAEPRTVLLVTHDVEEAVFLADRVAVLSPRPGPGGGRDRGRRCRARARARRP